ncbi:MAG: glycosyltransferase family 2 protein [Arenicellales bacterium]|nr:glycosyltransferase family 2 protein [Arenicellales bacterium]|tara:strand:- start:7337 stop:8761 length:1425 start_codon:yes stop_codon:yes gene_type:complete
MSSPSHQCPLCAAADTEYEFQIRNRYLRRCFNCEFLFAAPFPDSGDASPGVVSVEENSNDSPPIKTVPAERLLECIQKYTTGKLRRMAVAGLGASGLSGLARAHGIEIFEGAADDSSQAGVDACALLEALGATSHPVSQLAQIHGSLQPDGVLLLTLPMLDSVQARRQKGHWSGFNVNRVAYFDTHSLSSLLIRCGFCDIQSWPHDNGAVLICRKGKPRNQNLTPRLSVVLPVYNEEATCKELIDTVLAKRIEGVEREVVIVESNSTDGSREIVKRYEAHPDVRIVLEDQPRGKGHAVRNGISHADGDILLIQDADLEYDIGDYDALLEPLLARRRLFVLGSRHKGNWKMRRFDDRRWLGSLFNLGQIFFTWLINAACGTQLKDPFTMYKVFHRECLYGLRLEADRFDLDWEIVIKFIRKGLVPREIPVNYVSRSFSEGKKVRPLLDPILWLRALVRFRYGPLFGQDDPDRRAP